MPNVQDNGSKHIKYQRKTYSQKRRVYKKQSDFSDRNIESLPKIGTYSK